MVSICLEFLFKSKLSHLRLHPVPQMQVIHLGARKLVQKLYKGVVDEDFYGCGKVLPHGQRPAADDELNTYAGHQEGSKL